MIRAYPARCATFHRRDDESRIGNVNENVLPSPGTLRAQTSAPCAPTMPRTIARPSPCPLRGEVDLWDLEKRSTAFALAVIPQALLTNP
jgi:hypothetical protein